MYIYIYIYNIGVVGITNNAAHSTRTRTLMFFGSLDPLRYKLLDTGIGYSTRASNFQTAVWVDGR